jgi:RNA polymerase sigma factor (TIGR02999 family)
MEARQRPQQQRALTEAAARHKPNRPLSFRNGLAMSDVTQILDAIGQGDPSAAAQLLPLIYAELRRLAAAYLAREAPGHTLQPTALVHEAYLLLVGTAGEGRWNSRGHFFGAAARAMRRIPSRTPAATRVRNAAAASRARSSTPINSSRRQSARTCSPLTKP